MYRVLEEQGGTTFQEVLIDLDEQEASFEDRHFYPAIRINGIAYRPADNLIYGVLLEQPYVLCRIDADHQLERLKELPLPTNLLFVSGDISPDERYLVLLGFSPEESGNLLALVDLETPGYPTTIIPVAKTNPDETLYCADIAFHPTLNKLFGFEHSQGRLITIDLDNGLVDNTTYPVIDHIRGNMPTLFFDAFGHLFGIGAAEGVYSNRNLYQFNTEDGSAQLFQSLGFERNQDGCSCPFKVELLNRVSARQSYPCTVLEFEFTLINRTDREQVDLRLLDTFPAGAVITQLDELPFPGEVVRGPGGRWLDIRRIDLPLGSFSFKLRLELPEGMPAQEVFNRAYLKNVLLTSLSETETVLSDDPETSLADDPTYFRVRPLAVTFGETEPVLCAGDTLWLDSGIQGAESYRWNTGATTPAIAVTEPGTYQVVVTSNCQEAVGAIQVREEYLHVDLGPDRVLDRGEWLELQPLITSNAPVRLYHWATDLAESLSCQTCPNPVARPFSDANYHLLVENEWGCRAEDGLFLEVKPFQLYAPNAFSPNGDHNNDYFYLQSRNDYPIAVFRVFDRWGGLLFEGRNITTNQERAGWNGAAAGRQLQAGVFVWMAEIQTPDGESHWVSGEVTLVR